jgi:hypothetical protein
LKSWGKDNSDDQEDEQDLFAGGKSLTKFNLCGKLCHKSVDCYSKGKIKKSNQGRPAQAAGEKFIEDCFQCKKAGRRAPDTNQATAAIGNGKNDDMEEVALRWLFTNDNVTDVQSYGQMHLCHQL